MVVSCMNVSAKLRVALCITELRLGGAEQMLAELATRLDRSRFEPLVISLQPRPGENELHVLDALAGADVPVEFANMNSVLTLPRRLAKLRRIFQINQTQVCQSFLFHANFFSRLAARAAGVPVVVSGIRVAEREKMWHLCLDRMMQHFVDQYVCVSKGVADHTIEQGKIPQRKIVVIPNGVDMAKYENIAKADLGACGCSCETRKVVVVGRLHRQKGIDWLLQTTPYWLEQRSDCELLIVGDGPECNSLEKAAKQLPCAERIRFLGHRRDIPQLLAAADLLLSPSRWEGMPNVVMQAMAVGLPVVATEVEGIDELLTQQESHEADFCPLPRTCRFGATSEFAERINAILDRPAWGRQLGRQNREHIRRHFSIEQMVESYERLWQSLYEKHAVRGKAAW